MIFEPTTLKDVFLITLPAFDDERGSFTKIYHELSYSQQGISFHLKESYYSVSHKNVIRGMHFQAPPHDHEKIVFCPSGSITDVVVDIRPGSGTYGQHLSVELSADKHQALYIPKGCAHGFISREDHSITHYLVSSEHAPDSDTGILYNSFGMDWDCSQPIVSARDLSFVPLSDFTSPF